MALSRVCSRSCLDAKATLPGEEKSPPLFPSLMHWFYLLWVLLMSAGFAHSQALFVAPHQTPSEWLNLLTQEVHKPSPRARVSTHLVMFGDTNVQPLLQKKSSAQNSSASQGYFGGYRAYRVSLTRANWRLSYSWELADLYEGNQGAVRLYKEASQNALNPDTHYPVHATLNRSALSRWAIEYLGSYQQKGLTCFYTIELWGAFVRRAQQGTLQGEKNGDQFQGELTLNTTRGVPPSHVEGYAFGLDVGILAYWETGWSAGIHVANLWGIARINWVQTIRAEVMVNQLRPDAEGFLRGVPLLSGRIERNQLACSIDPSLQIGLAYQPSPEVHLALLGEHLHRWRWGVSAVHHPTGGWITLWSEPIALQIGYQRSPWKFSLCFDRLPFSRARLLGAEVGLEWHY